jgi:Predicted integral membrane protein (DUF2269)
VAELFVLLHVATAFWFVAGLLGRGVTIARARSAGDIELMSHLMDLAGRFERLMVIPGSMVVVLLGLFAAWWGDVPFTGEGNWWLLTSLLLFVAIGLLVPTVFLPRGKVFERAFEDAKSRGEITAELRSALDDPAVRNARWIELIVVALILTLMVTKPF